MTEGKPDGERCVACDIVFYGIAGLTALAVAAIAFDYITNGQLTQALGRLIDKAPVSLAAVLPMSREGAEDDADAGA
jgi:hypothetical protein